MTRKPRAVALRTTYDAAVTPPPPLWFRILLVASGVGMVAYQRLLPEPIATLKASPLAAVLTDRPLATATDADAILMGVVPLIVGAVLAATAVKREAGWVATVWRGFAGVFGSLLFLTWCAFLVPTMWPTSALLLLGAGLSWVGVGRDDIDTGGLGAALVFVAATLTSHFFVPLSNLASGRPRAALAGLTAAVVLWLAMRARPFHWHAPPRIARACAAVLTFATVTAVSGYFDVDQDSYGCAPPDPSSCPYDDPRLTWLDRTSGAIYYGVHLDLPRNQVIALARARYCDDDTTAEAAFFGVDGGELARVPIPDCDRAYDAGRPDANRLLPVCASGLQQIDLESRSLTTPPLERFTDFEVETAIERPDGSWWVSGVDQAVIARFDPTTLQEVERWWVADAIHVVTRLEPLDFIEPGLFLHASTTGIQVIDADFELRARRENLGANVFVSIDPTRGLAYVPDTARRRLRVWTLPDLEPHGEAPLDDGAYVAFHSPELAIQAVSYFKGSTIGFFDADSLESLGTLDVGPGPRGGVFDPASRRLFVASRCGLVSAHVDDVVHRTGGAPGGARIQ